MIADKLVSFNFSQSVILKDPITNNDIKKAGKHFLVENAIHIMEQGLFKFPVSDNILKEQFFNYKVVRRNPTTNKPVYGKVNEAIGDHRLDAFMLAIGGLVLEESVYSGKQMLPSVPTFHSKEESDWYVSPEEETRALFKKADREGLPGALNVLKIMRGMSEEEDRATKTKYMEQGLIKAPGRNSRSGSKKEQGISILEGINKYVGTEQGSRPISELQHSRRSGKFGARSRSWRR